MTIKRKGKKKVFPFFISLRFISFLISIIIIKSLCIYSDVCVYLENCHQPANKSLYIFNDDDDKYKRQLIFFPRRCCYSLFNIFMCMKNTHTHTWLDICPRIYPLAYSFYSLVYGCWYLMNGCVCVCVCEREENWMKNFDWNTA